MYITVFHLNMYYVLSLIHEYSIIPPVLFYLFFIDFCSLATNKQTKTHTLTHARAQIRHFLKQFLLLIVALECYVQNNFIV